MKVRLPHTERIHELHRLLDEKPDDDLRDELVRLEHERSEYIRGLLDEELQGVEDMGASLENLRRRTDSVRSQYKEACRIYRQLRNLVAHNRGVKKALRAELYGGDEDGEDGEA